MEEHADDVVVAGLACRLPESDNADEFWSHLINKEDMITEDDRRWTPGLHDLPKRGGKLKDIKSFDATFFSVHAKQAHKMDPQLRILLELTQEALIDAGVDPQSVRNTKTGVFIGASSSDASEANTHITEDINGYGLVGGCRAMFSNRISFSFDFKGPSFTIDTACSSSLLAMDCAVQSIRAGSCDAAIVGGVSVTLKPNGAVDFLRLNMLSADGKCKTFDASGDGYVRSEGAVCTYLVKRRAAKRIYAEVINSKTNSDGYKSQGVTYPSGAAQKQLLQEVYAETKVKPSQVSYIEAHGTGTKAGDPEEVNAIVDVFCKERENSNPLLIGSAKSNMGHSEPASGLAGLTKVLVSMQHSILPPNLHFENPNPNIPGLLDGRAKVVTEVTKWEGGYVGINSFGFGGSNVHVILKSPSIEDGKSQKPVESVCLPVCGRTKDAAEKLIKLAKENTAHINLIPLMAEIAFGSVSYFPYRGYVVVGSERNHSEIIKVTSKDNPVWYVFAGMGAQWHGMGKDMMSITTFEESIKKSSSYLKEYDFDLETIIVQSTDDTYKSTLNSFVGTAAIQVALVDCLIKIGLKPDGIIGHSVGELGCAYADGSFTAEEVIKAAYWRGRCVTEANLPTGAMAAVGLTWEEAKRRCPPGIIPACHNALNTVTISGEKRIVDTFLEELRSVKIFVRAVDTSGIAFHSHFMAAIAPTLRSSLQKFIVPKRRSPKWVSSSIPEERWDCELAQFSSAEYHVNNLVSPVLFQEALQKIPKGAVVVEIAPHCLLQGVLKRSLKAQQTVIPLMKKGDLNNVDFFLSNLGKIYNSGIDVNPTLLRFYNNFPVPISTPSIAPHMMWDHSQEWDVPNAEQFSSAGIGGAVNVFEFEIDISNESMDCYLEGHCIDGRVLFPATGYLVLAWKALARKMNLIQEKLAVEFKEIEIHRATILSKTDKTTLKVFLLPASNRFEVSEGDNLSVSGKIDVLHENDFSSLIAFKIPEENGDIKLSSDCIYKELRLRGYDYGPTFQGIEETNNAGETYILFLE